MKKLLLILFLLITVQISFGQQKYVVKIKQLPQGIISIANNATGDSLIYYINNTRHAIPTPKDTTNLKTPLYADGDTLKIDLSNYTTQSQVNDSIVAVSARTVQSVAGKTGTVTLTKSDVGLSNVDNTSDLSKPISTATQTALNAKQATLVSGTNIKTINGNTLLGIGDIPVSADSSLFATQTNLYQKATNWFNILKYGASPSKTSAQNTIAINNAIAAALPSSGTVYVPSGIYLVDSLIWDSRVSVIGDGVGSVLKSNSSVSMITASMSLVNNDIPTAGTFSRIVLDGDSIGTTGLNLTQVAKFSFNDVFIKNFTAYGANMKGCLIGQFTNVRFLWCETGYKSTKTGLMQSNLITFQSCQFTGCTTWGMDYGGGSGVNLISCDFEGNGVAGSTTTGAFSFGDSQGGVAFTMKNSWFEDNKGISVNIGTPSLNVTNRYFIKDCKMNAPNAGSTIGIMMSNGVSSSSPNILDLSGTDISGNTTKDISIDGAYAVINYTSSTFATSSSTNGANIFNPQFKRWTGANYRNLVVGDPTFYSGSNSLEFLVDNGAKKISFSVASAVDPLSIYTNYVNIDRLTVTGSPVTWARLGLPAGSTSFAPLGFTNGTLLSTLHDGSLEYATKLYFTYGANRVPLLDSTTASTTYQKVIIKSTATLTAGTVTVSCPSLTSTSRIMVTVNTTGGTPGFISVPSASRTVGTSFVINSSSATDTSTLDYTVTN